MTCQYHYEILMRPTQLGGGVRLYLYGPNLETGEQIDYGSTVFPSDLADPDTLKNAYTAAQQEGESWLDKAHRHAMSHEKQDISSSGPSGYLDDHLNETPADTWNSSTNWE